MALSDYLTPHFRLSEFASRDGAPFTDSAIDNLRRQAQLLEIIRSAAGDKPITVNSGYRSPAHNDAVGGATHSQHPLGTASDFNIAGMSPRQATNLITGLIDQGKLPSGGLGVYNNWVHYDHRQNGNARWAEDGGPVPARARVVNNGYAMQPETSGAAPAAFVDAPQGRPVPPESAKAEPVRPDIQGLGMDVTKSLLEDLKANAGSFNYADSLKAREAFQSRVLDQYGESQKMGLEDLPGAVLGAPILALKHLLAPVRRAMGSREQQSLDMWGGQGGLETLAAYSGDPTIAEKYKETPGAGNWLMGLVTDAQERRANAARAAMAQMGAFDKRLAENSKTFLLEAQRANAMANATQSLLGGLNDTNRTAGSFAAANANIGQSDAAAYQSIMSGNKSAADTIEIPAKAAAQRARDNAAAANSNAHAEAARALLPGQQALLDARIAHTNRTGAGGHSINPKTLLSLPAEIEKLKQALVGLDPNSSEYATTAAAITDAAKALGLTTEFTNETENSVIWGPSPKNSVKMTRVAPTVAIRMGNVGNAQNSTTSSASPEAASAINRGDISSDRYKTGDRKADEARLIADYQKGLFTDDEHFRRIAKEAGFDD